MEKQRGLKLKVRSDCWMCTGMLPVPACLLEMCRHEIVDHIIVYLSNNFVGVLDYNKIPSKVFFLLVMVGLSRFLKVKHGNAGTLLAILFSLQSLVIFYYYLLCCTYGIVYLHHILHLYLLIYMIVTHLLLLRFFMK